jgi:Fe2+ or Zn2+ uptake regulation protein
MSTLVSQAEKTLRARGGRMTAQRRLILEALDRLGGHPTAEQVYRAVHDRDMAINPSTVYRTLGWLEEAGLVSHRHLDQGPRGEHCERFDPGSPIEHHHFVCSVCGRVEEFESAQIEAAKLDFMRRYGAQVEQASLTFHGICASCRAGSARAPARSRAGAPAHNSQVRER